jgi:hypothetical protein
MEVSGQLHAPATLPPGKEPPPPRYQFYMRLGGPQSRSGIRGNEKILAPTGLELRPLCRPARSQSLYRLCYPGSQMFKNRILKYLLFLKETFTNYSLESQHKYTKPEVLKQELGDVPFVMTAST